MKNNLRSSLTPLLLYFMLFLFPTEALAVCPVCTVAVGAGVGLSRYLGIDDTISGIWIGGLVLSSSLWLINILSSRHNLFNKTLNKTLVTVLMYLLFIVPLFFTDIIGHPLNTVLGIDKIVAGIAIGSILFYASILTDNHLRSIYKRQLINYQKVILPILYLLLASAAVFFII